MKTHAIENRKKQILQSGLQGTLRLAIALAYISLLTILFCFAVKGVVAAERFDKTAVVAGMQNDPKHLPAFFDLYK
jgi:hypothetical protein